MPRKKYTLRFRDLKMQDNMVNNEQEESLLCPITHEIMVDPVVAADGFSYDRKAIEVWLANNNTSPMTNAVLKNKSLIPNTTLMVMIMEYQEQLVRNTIMPLDNEDITFRLLSYVPSYASSRVCRANQYDLPPLNIKYIGHVFSHVNLNPQDLDKFLKHIGFGEQDEAEAMLKVNSELAFMPGDLIDCAGRVFKQISGFQYAVWALDWHMWTMIKKYIEKPSFLSVLLKQQLITLNNEGVDIKESRGGGYRKTKQVSWQNLIDALQKNIDNYHVWTNEQRQSHWCHQVGRAQLTLPTHVINEYNFPASISRWCGFVDGQELGKDFAWSICKSGFAIREASSCISTCSHDLEVVSSLFNVRTGQRTKLVSSVTQKYKPKLLT